VRSAECGVRSGELQTVEWESWIYVQARLTQARKGRRALRVRWAGVACGMWRWRRYLAAAMKESGVMPNSAMTVLPGALMPKRSMATT